MTGLMDFEFDERLAYAATLPARFYVGAETLVAERERMFAASWQLAGRTDQLPESGSYFTTEILGEPLLIVRDQAGEVRGFYNVCRHRAGRVAEGTGCRSTFRCGYHGWTYSSDGSLIGVPDFDGVQNFDKADFALKPVRVAVWEQLTCRMKPKTCQRFSATFP